MKSRKFTRRQVIATTSAGVLGSMLNFSFKPFTIANTNQSVLAYQRGDKVHKVHGPTGLYGTKQQNGHFGYVPFRKVVEGRRGTCCRIREKIR
jgi:hypothetical protein